MNNLETTSTDSALPTSCRPGLALYFPKPEEQLAELINRMAVVIPIELLLREGVVNGIEANERYSNNSKTESRKEVKVSRDYLNHKSLLITNYDGEFLSIDICKKNLGTIANSGNWSKIAQILGLAKNKGQGIKLWLRWGDLEFRCKNPDGISHSCILHKEGEVYRFKSVLNPDLDDYNSFPDYNNFGKELAQATSGTEVVLHSRNGEDVWETFCAECSLRGKKTTSGHTIQKWLSNRFFEDPGAGHEISVAIYNKEGQFTTFRKVNNLLTQINKSTLPKGIIKEADFPYRGVPKGSEIHWFMIEHNHTNSTISSLDRAINGFAWKKETYYSSDIYETIRANKSCGIFAKTNKFGIIFRLPSDFEANPTEDRRGLQSVDKSLFYDWFNESMPEEISTMMAKSIVSKNNEDIQKNLKEKFKDFFCPEKSSTVSMSGQKSLISATRKLKSRKKPKPGQKNREPMTRTDVRWLIKYNRTPQLVLIDDPGQPLVEFYYNNDYKLVVNKAHTLFKGRMDKIKTNFKYIQNFEIEHEVFAKILEGAFYRILEVTTIEDHFDSRMSLCQPEILESTWTRDSGVSIETQLRKTENKRKRNKNIEEILDKSEVA